VLSEAPYMAYCFWCYSACLACENILIVLGVRRRVCGHAGDGFSPLEVLISDLKSRIRVRLLSRE